MSVLLLVLLTAGGGHYSCVHVGRRLILSSSHRCFHQDVGGPVIPIAEQRTIEDSAAGMPMTSPAQLEGAAVGPECPADLAASPVYGSQT